MRAEARISGLTFVAGLLAVLLGSGAPPPAERAASAAGPEDCGDCEQVELAAEPLIPAPPPTLVDKPSAAPAPAVEHSPARRKPEARTLATAPATSAPALGGGLRVVVSIPQQKAWVFRGSKLVASAPVSTGKRGYETPVGRFRILQKKVEHYSSKYDNAPMPYMQRLTSYGVALHAGRVPGYPASHGCIRLPHGFARKLYNMTGGSTRVTVTRARPKSAKDALNLA
jgi:lipoprotein-anchoring transpeptidase ErfK/SrfK